jgi:malonyl-CoA decarboxylase
MAGDLSSTAPFEATSRVNYRIDVPDRSIASPTPSGAAVRDTLRRCRDLLAERGEAPESGSARSVLASCASFDEAARAEFFDGLIERFAASETRRELFLRLNGTPGATAWLVRMREHLDDRPAWAAIESDLAHVLRLIFNHGVLDFQRIGLDAPSSLLERLIEAEAVHAINDRREMARRLEADRRCYALFHPGWPHEPLIFTEVALTRGVASAIQPILDPDSAVVDPRTCDTAMFYSISNCQPGLRGFAFGNSLLTRAIERLQAEMPWLRRFATISPIPGFRSWLSKSAASLDASTGVGAWLSSAGSRAARDEPLPPDELQRELTILCAHYLLRVKQGSEPADAVARFHLANGARLQRLNPASDVSPAGIRRSAGLTVNYVYEISDLERNAARYGRCHELLAAPEVARLARHAASLLT